MEYYALRGLDIGGHTKSIPFVGRSDGTFWYDPSFDPTADPPRVVTPHHGGASDFMARLQTTLTQAALWGSDTTIRGISICSPVVGTTCLNLVNRGIHEPFMIENAAVLNDGFAATIGSLLAGVAQGHPGALAFLTLGTGVGYGALHWDHTGHRVTNDGESHVLVRDGILPCNCGRKSCFEASANEAALRHYAQDAGWETEDITTIDVGYTFLDILNDPEHEHFTHVTGALDRWHTYLAQGIATMCTLVNMGGSPFQPPALFVLGGGLSHVVDEQKLHNLVITEWEKHPLIGTNLIIRKETVLGNKAGCIGAAAHALAQKLNKNIVDIQFLTAPPARD